MKWFIGFCDKNDPHGWTDVVNKRWFASKKACQAECDVLNTDGSGWEHFLHYPIKEADLSVWTVKTRV